MALSIAPRGNSRTLARVNDAVGINLSRAGVGYRQHRSEGSSRSVCATRGPIPRRSPISASDHGTMESTSLSFSKGMSKSTPRESFKSPSKCAA